MIPPHCQTGQWIWYRTDEKQIETWKQYLFRFFAYEQDYFPYLQICRAEINGQK